MVKELLKWNASIDAPKKVRGIFVFGLFLFCFLLEWDFSFFISHLFYHSFIHFYFLGLFYEVNVVLDLGDRSCLATTSF